MSGYIGSKASVTQVDGYNRTEADGRYVNASGDTITGQLGVGATDLNSNKVVIEGGNAGQHSSNLKLTTGAGTNGLVSDLSFYATFVAPTSDTGPRRTADITSGYATDNWGTEYLAIGVGGATDYANVTTERFRIDGAGRVTMPYQPAFHAYGNNGLSASNEPFLIVWPSIRHNIGGHYNPSTGYFTAPVTGMYHFGCGTIAGNAGTTYRLRPRINGISQGDMHLRIDTEASGSEYGTNATYSFTFYLNANDTVSIWGSNDLGLSWYGAGATDNDYYRFWGYLIG